MLECAVRIEPSAWEHSLRCVADTRRLRLVEMTADLLEAPRSAALDMVDHLGLRVLHVPDAIPITLGRFFSEATFRDIGKALQTLRQGVVSRLRGGVRIASFDLGLDRIGSGEEDSDHGFRRRIALLEYLLTEISDVQVRLALRIRMPRPFPASHEWEWAGNIIHEVGRERCALALDIVVADADLRLDPGELIRSCASQLSLVRLLYDATPEERPSMDTHTAWSEALRRHAPTVAVVFCPRVNSTEQVAAAIRDIERWHELYVL